MVWATNVTKFQMDRPLGSWRSQYGGYEQLYRDAFPWMEAMGKAKGKPDAVVDVLQFGDKFFEQTRYRNNQWVTTSDPEKEKYFKEALGKLLVAQQEKVIAPAKKAKNKKQKTSA